MPRKALILNGERKGESTLGLAHQTAINTFSLDNWRVETVILHERKIARCSGCFGCWTKTPGVCVIDDFGRELAEKAVQCDLMLCLTPIAFGGYSSELKKAVDRFACPMQLPFFTKIDGEVHHKARYESLPRLICIGVLPGPEDESERLFTKLVKRNAINFHSPAAQAIIIYHSQDREQIAERLQAALRNIWQ
ncbi:MAG TPA: NAD(P)H-dependent oxidoreductase [Thermodesulfovibrionales bacterium]|nr:NAD(P)H-dependent oxidoreductase [Thermodesulfovibrionales bacterium]